MYYKTNMLSTQFHAILMTFITVRKAQNHVKLCMTQLG